MSNLGTTAAPPSRFYLRQNPKTVLPKASGVALLGVLMGLLFNLIRIQGEIRYPLLGLTFLWFMGIIWRFFWVRILVDEEVVGVATASSLWVKLKVLPRQQIRKLVLSNGELKFIDKDGRPFLQMPSAGWSPQTLRLLAAALPCYSNGLFPLGPGPTKT